MWRVVYAMLGVLELCGADRDHRKALAEVEAALPHHHPLPLGVQVLQDLVEERRLH